MSNNQYLAVSYRRILKAIVAMKSIIAMNTAMTNALFPVPLKWFPGLEEAIEREKNGLAVQEGGRSHE